MDTLALMCVCMISLLVRDTVAEWNLVWEDDFETLDYNKWMHEITASGFGNGEFQLYTNDPQNSYVRDGVLYLKPTLTTDTYGQDVFENGAIDLHDIGYCSQNYNNGCYREKQDIPPVLSARLRSYQRFSFKYGKMVIEAKMPSGDWLWPAMWLLPDDWKFGPWPVSGEIDLVEIKGNRDLKTPSGEYLGIQHMGSALHWGPSPDYNRFDLTLFSQFNETENYADYFHTYEMEWTEDRMISRIDDMDVMTVPTEEQKPTWTGFWDYGLQNGGWGELSNPWEGGNKMTPFDQEFHIILNVAVGSTNGFFPDDGVNNGGLTSKPWRNGVSQTEAMTSFWAAKEDWYPTWRGEDSALQIRSIKVYQEGTGSGNGSSTISSYSINILIVLQFITYIIYGNN